MDNDGLNHESVDDATKMYMEGVRLILKSMALMRSNMTLQPTQGDDGSIGSVVIAATDPKLATGIYALVDALIRRQHPSEEHIIKMDKDVLDQPK